MKLFNKSEKETLSNITFDELTYPSPKDERIRKRFKEKLNQRYAALASLDEAKEPLHLGPEIVRDILSDVYKDFKQERQSSATGDKKK